MSTVVPLRSRQAAVPFTIQPNSSTEDGPISIYSFRGGESSGYNSLNGASVSYAAAHLTKRVLGIYPDSYERAIQEDISMQHLFGIDYSTGKFVNDLTFDTIMQNIPAITIREYLPESRLDSTISYFTNLYHLATRLFTSSKEEKEQKNNAHGIKVQFTKDDLKKLFTAIGQMAKWAFEYITETGEFENTKASTGLWKSINVTKAETYGNANKLAENNPGLQKALFNFPFTLYYFIQSSLTTNIYEFPAITSDGRLYSSSGHEGWNTGANEISLTGMLSKVPALGTMLKNIVNNVSINFMPWWDAEAGHKTAEPEITIKFHLFNDNIVKAISNFICVNNFIANNKWFQYYFYQHAPSLYEIKLDGYNRLFACTCNAVVKSVGNLRTPPSYFYDGLLINGQGMSNKRAFVDNLAKNRSIKIPDVYEVELTFKSILPANFNNFMYQYSAAAIDMETSKYNEAVSASVKKVYEDFTQKAKAKFEEFYSGSDAANAKPAQAPKEEQKQEKPQVPASTIIT